MRTVPEAEAEQGHQEGGGMPLGMETVDELPSWDSDSSSQIYVGSVLLCPVVIFGDVGEGDIGLGDGGQPWNLDAPVPNVLYLNHVCMVLGSPPPPLHSKSWCRLRREQGSGWRRQPGSSSVTASQSLSSPQTKGAGRAAALWALPRGAGLPKQEEAGGGCRPERGPTPGPGPA